MTPHDLLANFEILAEAPNGNSRLRELLLELAMRGKLVEQDPADEPAIELVNRIQQRLPIMRKRRNGTLGHSDSELASIQAESIPEGWYACTLGSVLRLINGRAYSRPELLHSGTPIIRIQNLNGGNSWFYSDLELEDDKYCVDGDLLFAWSATFGPYIWRGSRSIYHYHIWKIDLLDGCDIQFMYYLFQAISERVRSKAHGVAMLHMTKEGMEAWPVTIPPLSEQRRIVARVGELMSLLDRLEAKRQEREAIRAAARNSAVSALREATTHDEVQTAWLRIQDRFGELFATPDDVVPLRQTVLQVAVQGRLVPQNHCDGSADDLLKSIALNKARLQSSGQIGKDKSSASVDQAHESFQIPEPWRWTKLEDLTELITKGSSPKWQGISYVSESEGVLFITSENVGNYNLRKLSDLKYVGSRFNEIEPRSVLKHGDLLINLVGASIGRSAKYSMHDGANINQAVALIRLVRGNEGVCPEFLLHYLNSPPAIDYMLGSRVVNAQPNISLTDAREFPVPVPPFAEQRRIVEKVNELMAKMDQLVEALECETEVCSAFAAAAAHHLET